MEHIPSYEELVEAFSELLANVNNDGDPVLPNEADIERASNVLARTNINTPYYDWSAK